jgi:hypothetical protein
VVSSVKLQCETADTLRLRKVLDPRIPQHRALLPAAAVPPAAAAAAVPAGAAAASALQHGVGVKREEPVDLAHEEESDGVAVRTACECTLSGMSVGMW